MKLNLNVISMLIIFMGLTGIFRGLVFAETSDIVIEKTEDHEKAIIPNSSEATAPVEKKSKKEMKMIEDKTLGVAQTSTHLIGKGTDKAVGTVQKVGDSVFARWFKALDFSNKKSHSSTVSEVEKGE